MCYWIQVKKQIIKLIKTIITFLIDKHTNPSLKKNNIATPVNSFFKKKIEVIKEETDWIFTVITIMASQIKNSLNHRWG